MIGRVISMAAVIGALLVGGCETAKPLSFPIAYQMIHAPEASPGPEVMMLYFNEEERMIGYGRNDASSIEAGPFLTYDLCNAGLFCLRVEEFAPPAIVLPSDTDAITFEGWNYSVRRDVLARSPCDDYEAWSSSETFHIIYRFCGGGLFSFAVYDGERLRIGYERRSYLGVGAQF